MSAALLLAFVLHTLCWDPSKMDDGTVDLLVSQYVVYRAAEPCLTPIVIGTTGTALLCLPLTLPDPAPGQVYFYYVTSKYPGGAESITDREIPCP